MAFLLSPIKNQKNRCFFFLAVDMGTETLVNSKGKPTDVRQKTVNYQALFRIGQYKRYEKTSTLYILFKENSPLIGRVLPPGQPFP